MQKETVSIWSYILYQNKKDGRYNNHLYKQAKEANILDPDYSTKELVFWKRYFMKYRPKSKK